MCPNRSSALIAGAYAAVSVMKSPTKVSSQATSSRTGAEIVLIGGTSLWRMSEREFRAFNLVGDSLHHRRAALRTISPRLAGLRVALRIHFHLRDLQRGRVHAQPTRGPSPVRPT